MNSYVFPTVTDKPIGVDLIQTVDARELHAFLLVGKKFADWIKERIEQYAFAEDADFTTFSQNGEKGRPTIEYALTLDMAKELSMVERTDRGKQARQYFLACERKAKAGITADDLLSNPKQLLAITQGYALQIEDMRREIDGMKPEVAAFDRIANADGTLGVREGAKAAQMTEQKFIAWLMQNRWCYRQSGSRTLLGYAEKVRAGLLTHKVSTYTKSDGSEGISERVRLTGAGLARSRQGAQPVAGRGRSFLCRPETPHLTFTR